MKKRCTWAGDDALMTAYHDKEWGTPLHNDNQLFEFLCLEGAQAGLSWATVLRKREAYRQAFDQFDPNLVARYGETKIQNLLQNKGIIRNKLKVRAFITNARQFLKLQSEFGSFDKYIWQFVNHRPIQNRWNVLAEIPASTPASETMSKDLKKRGFTFVGPTICYALMQAIGMVNDHTVDCFRHREIERLSV